MGHNQFRSGSDFQQWLTHRSNDVCSMLLTRSALRILPIIVRDISDNAEEKRAHHFLQLAANCFQSASANLLITGKVDKLSKSIVSLYDDLSNSAKFASNASATASSIVARTMASAVALSVGGRATAQVGANAATEAAAGAAFVAPARAERAKNSVWNGISGDASFLDRAGDNLSELTTRALWPDGMPDWAEIHWERLRARYLKSDDWEVWVEWYEDRLSGHSESEAYEMTFAHIPDSARKEGFAYSNRWLRANLPARKAALPQPVPDVPSPVTYGWNDTSQLTLVSGPQNLPIFPFASSEHDHARLLEACQRQAERLSKDLSAGKYNVRSEYAESIERYRDDLPARPGSGNVMLADAEARILRDMFEVDFAVLSPPFASRLKALLQQHIGLRPFYPELERFYDAVREGRLDAPLPQDAVDEFAKIIRENTPSIFASEITVGLREIEREPPIIELEPEDLQGKHDSVMPPADPLGRLEPKKSRAFSVASSINALYTAFLKGKDLHDAIDGWTEVAHRLGEKIGPITDWLRGFLRIDDL